jgi:hypothetical protein
LYKTLCPATFLSNFIQYFGLYNYSYSLLCLTASSLSIIFNFSSSVARSSPCVRQEPSQYTTQVRRDLVDATIATVRPVDIVVPESFVVTSLMR